MNNIRTFLTEAKNTHLEHLEDEIINNGVSGGKNAINFLTALADMLESSSKRKMNVTVKWDGAPAIFAGTNPENGKFFVGTKSIFNKTPKINYTFADVVTEVQFEGFLEDPLKPFIDIDLAGISIENIGDDMTNDQKEKSQEVVVPVILTRIASISAFAFRRKIW